MLHLNPLTNRASGVVLAQALQTTLPAVRELRVIYGPHGAPEYFTGAYINTFFATDWEVHFNSSRTGIRLIGPKPEWVRESGGEAGCTRPIFMTTRMPLARWISPGICRLSSARMAQASAVLSAR